MFLQEMGRAYDLQRGYLAYTNRQFKVVLEHFDHICCFCGSASEKLTKDHLVPINRTSLGLEAWGNVVPACISCNSSKHSKDWNEFLKKTAGVCYEDRHNRINGFVEKYGYSPSVESIRLAVEELYEETGAIVQELIKLKTRRALIRSEM
jgi:hypothetical protein